MARGDRAGVTVEPSIVLAHCGARFDIARVAACKAKLMTLQSTTPVSVSLNEILAESQEIMRESRELLEFSQRITFEQRLTVIKTQTVLSESYSLLRKVGKEPKRLS